MKIVLSSIMLSLLLAFVEVPNARAVDEGQTKPRINKANLNSPNSSTDLIPYTADSGNIKGLQCQWSSIATGSTLINFYVDGGAAETITLQRTNFLKDADGNYYTGFIPMNVRFETSIRVQMQRPGSNYGDSPCVASWGFD